MARLTLHLVPEDTWDAQDPAVPYLPAAYPEDGFVHCTDGDAEMVVVANRFYAADPRSFLLLTLDLERTGSPWRFDDPERALSARLRADRPGLGRRGAAHGALGRRRLHRSRAALTPAGVSPCVSGAASPARRRRPPGDPGSA